MEREEETYPSYKQAQPTPVREDGALWRIRRTDGRLLGRGARRLAAGLRRRFWRAG